MRAFSGSKSRWSIASQFYYMAGAVTNAFGGERPNITSGVAIPTAAMLEGQVSAKYNISAAHSIMVGTGLDWVTPFQGGAAPNDYNRKIDVNNPYLVYQYLYKWSGIQSALQFEPIYFTRTSSVNEGYFLDSELAQNSVYEIGHTGLSLALYTAVYDNPYFAKSGMQSIGGPPINLSTVQAEYGFYIDPFVDIKSIPSSIFALSLIFGITIIREETQMRPRKSPLRARGPKSPGRSFGVGIKVTRDIFLFPNIQFLPEQLRSDMTNYLSYVHQCLLRGCPCEAVIVKLPSK